MSDIAYTQGKYEDAIMDYKIQKWDFGCKVVTAISAIITVLSLIVGGVWTAKEYFDKQEQEILAKKREYEFSLYKERKETLYPLCNAAAEIVSSKSLKEAKKSIRTFETLYYGEVGIIANGQIADAIKSFAESLLEYKEGSANSGPPLALIARSSELAIKCKEVLNLEKVYGISQSSLK